MIEKEEGLKSYRKRIYPSEPDKFKDFIDKRIRKEKPASYRRVSFHAQHSFHLHISNGGYSILGRVSFHAKDGPILV